MEILQVTVKSKIEKVPRGIRCAKSYKEVLTKLLFCEIHKTHCICDGNYLF